MGSPSPGVIACHCQRPTAVPQTSRKSTTKKTPPYTTGARPFQRKNRNTETPIAPPTSKRGSTVRPKTPHVAAQAATATTNHRGRARTRRVSLRLIPAR